MKDAKDDLLGLPTRTGTPTGHANERQMLEKIRDNLGFETTARVRPDGSYTLLRTKGGMPRFITDPVPPAVASIIARGFLARATAKPFGAIFDPYDLDIEVKQYKPASITYYVGKVQAAAYEPRKWRDVWSWDGSLLRINGVQAKTFYKLKFPTDVKAPAIPYIIPWPSAPIYGTKETNLPFAKRVFAIGPESVGIAVNPAYGATIAALKLHPETPRTDRKALVCGAAIDPTAHEATLSQLYFTGALWDSLAGGWAISTSKVAMLLTLPFLQVAASEFSVGEFSGYSPDWIAEPTSGSRSSSITLPDAVVGVVGEGEVYSVYTNNRIELIWPWTDTYKATLSGTIQTNYTAHERIYGEADYDLQQGGETLIVSASNSKSWERRSDIASVPSQYVELPSSGNSATNILGALWSSDISGWHWSGGVSPAAGTRGYDNKLFAGDNIPLVGTTYAATESDYYAEEQNIDFSVATESGKSLVSCHITKSKRNGNDYTITPDMSWLDYHIDNPLSFVSTNSGFSKLHIDLSNDTPGYEDQWPIIVSEANKWVGTKYYESSFLDDAHGSMFINLYTAEKVISDGVVAADCTWSTSDYLLFDALNGVFVSVEGNFSGTGDDMSGSGTLTILVKIEASAGAASLTIAEFSLSFGSFLPDTLSLSDKAAIPSPKVPTIFAPAFREQGAFRGAAYVTADEESNGAAPAIVVNFVLALETYAFIGQDEPTDKMVHFVPCNLLEMLYAFVYSRGYGIDPYYRYPVTDSAAYSAIMAGLFGVQHHIHYRDGAFSDWGAGLGNPYYADNKTELSRV